ncbi:MAG: ABC transporter ATP-binding protein [Planctomycetota bacterium]
MERPDASRESAVDVVQPVMDVIDASYTYQAGRKRQAKTIGPVSLKVGAGERVAMIGPNGSGKSTLVQLMSGTFTPTDGSLRWFGSDRDISARRRIGVVFQSPSLDALLTVRETLRLAGRLLQMTKPMIERRIGELVEELDIADRIDARIGTLSGGLARRVDLARAIMHEPELVLLDEPTAGLDDESANAFNAMLARLVSSGVTVVAATHTLAEVRLSERVIVMMDGRVAIDEPVAASDGDSTGTLLCVEGRSERLHELLREAGIEQSSDGQWWLDPQAVPTELVSTVVQEAIESGGTIRTEQHSMHSYFARAQQVLASSDATAGAMA